MRILDSKNPKEIAIIQDAPSILDFISESDKKNYEKIKKLLDNLGVKYTENPCLVRGLDYYS